MVYTFSFLSSKFDPDREEGSCNFDGLGNQKLPSITDSKAKEGEASKRAQITVSPKGDAKRKRGRPFGKSVKRGTGLGRARRTRPRIGKSAKLCEIGSDESGPSGDDTNEGGNKTNRGNQEIDAEVSNEVPEMKQTGKDDSKSSHLSKVAEKEIAEDDDKQEEWVSEAYDVKIGEKKQDEVPDIGTSERHYEQGKENTEKLEVMVDPLHAMLIDMIPSLGMKREETMNPILDREKPSVDPDVQPTKKKKVSYKDIVGGVFKD